MFTVTVLANEGWDGLDANEEPKPEHAVIQYLAAIERYGIEGLIFQVRDEETNEVTVVRGDNINISALDEARN